MTPYYDDGQARFYLGDVREVLRELPAGSVNMCVTSPPYWGLRDYGTATWDGGDAACDHSPEREPRTKRPASGLTGSKEYVAAQEPAYRDICGKCGARRIDNQLGLEATPDLFVAHIVEVFREVRRVLADDATLWLNIGDSYAGSWGAQGRQGDSGQMASRSVVQARSIDAHPQRASGTGSTANMPGIKPKDLVGIPWMVAFALRADGWWLRQDIIWAKPNPMPESVTDRCTKAHEYLFLLSKRATYYYDSQAIKEEDVTRAQRWISDGMDDRRIPGQQPQSSGMAERKAALLWQGRNKRSVWSIATAPFSARALGGGRVYIASEACPEHGLRGDPQSWQMAARGERPDPQKYRIDGNVARLALERLAESEANFSHSPWPPAIEHGQTPENTDENRMPGTSTFDGSLDDGVPFPRHTNHTQSSHAKTVDSSHLPGLAGSATATPHSTGTRRTVGESAQGDTPDEETAAGTECTSPSRGDLESDGCDSHVPTQTPVRKSRKCSCTEYTPDHFATFPPALVEPCILAGSREGGTVLDPFLGSGTTALVAKRLGRRVVGIDLNSEYLEMARRRCAQMALLGEPR